MLRANAVGYFVLEWLDLHETVQVRQLVEAVIEIIVVTLGVEINDSILVELAGLRLIDHDILYRYDVLEKLL